MNTTPLAQDLWDGIAGQFDSISQVLCEFIDNSISNFEAEKIPHKTVHITIEKNGRGKVQFSLEDSGFGIKDFEPVFKLGDKSIRQTPLNEHGFGLKHALATANPSNDSWKIYTRTNENFKNHLFRVASAPFSFDMEEEIIQSHLTEWPGRFNGSGTVITFETSESLFDTIQRGIQGKAGFDRCLDYLREELGYIYSGVIERGMVNITVASHSAGYDKSVEAVKPAWQGFYKPGNGTENVDLGGGKLSIEYTFGEIGPGKYINHYKKNMSTSGAEIRINGRLMVANLFKDIWNLEEHPFYNHFSAVINLVSQDRNTLPKTRTSKNGIRSGDEKLKELFEWIRSTHPTPHKELAGAVSEKELVKELASLKETQIRNTAKHIELEFRVFTTVGSPVAVDLYVFDGQDIVLYEAKKEIADMQNLYQLLMYWDGAVADGLHPTEGILLASSFSPGVEIILSFLNKMTDQNGENYCFSLKTWKDESIVYPAP